MSFGDRSLDSKTSFRCICLTVALIVVGALASRAKAEAPEHPTFRKGIWHFVRTLDLVVSSKVRHRLLEREMTRCVDPTQAMKVTFSSVTVGNCVSTQPKRFDNQYTIANRCDYMGPVSTVITVDSDEYYTEVIELTVGEMPRTELVVARRIGDCQEDVQNFHRPAALSH